METTDQMLSTPLPGPHAACLAGRICGEEVWKLLRPTEKSMVIADARHDFCLDGITHGSPQPVKSRDAAAVLPTTALEPRLLVRQLDTRVSMSICCSLIC